MRSWPALVITGIAVDDTDSPTSALVYAALSDYPVAAMDEPSSDSLRAFFHDTADRDRALTALPPQFPAITFTATDVEDEDWAARSQADLTAVHVDRIVVSPPWDVDTAHATPDATLVVIQPSMGFGTGHHATTRLCLAALQRANVRGRSVIDVGTGSGVLAIAASLLGASPVIGVDDDPDAIRSASENLALNPAARVDLRVGDLRSSTLGVADVVLANLTGTLLVQAAGVLDALIAPHGRLILSGLMDHEEASVLAAFPGLSVLHRSQEDEWVCLQLTRPHAFE